MKKSFLILGIAATVILMMFTGCKKYLDINSDPDTPQSPDVSSIFPAVLGAIPRGLQFDARYASKYVQNFGSNTSGNVNNMERQGYNAASDVNGDIWRMCYFAGANLNYIIDKGSEQGQWDYVGAAQVLKAMMFQYTTDYHGEIIFTEAFAPNKAFFKYDDQETVYAGIDSILRLGISNLNRTDLKVTSTRLVKGDYVFAGNSSKWIKFAWGLMARNAHRITNKAEYNADSVIAFCNRSMADFNDDFLIPFDAVKNDDANFFGITRDNLTLFRQSDFIVKLLDGTILTSVAGNIPPTPATAFNRDPRMKHMLTASEDTTNGNGGFRGVAIATGDPNAALTLKTQDYPVGSTNWINARKRVPLVWLDSSYQVAAGSANPSVNVFGSPYKRYLFANNCVFPIMTASEIQFIKSEAAFKKGDLSTALTAYTNGISYHFDFINRGTFPRGNVVIYNGAPISSAARLAYMNGNNVKQSTATLTITDIMMQKYIALWGWGFFETFVDIRRYHWINDLDPATGLPVYKTMVLPSPLFTDNFGKPVYRVRPRYNSEYIWNRDELLRIGGLNLDYHTYETWFSQP